MIEENVGYIIVEKIKVSNKTFVLGYNPKIELNPYVTWERNGINPNYRYNYGHYMGLFKDAEFDLLRRGLKYLLIYDFPDIDMDMSLEDFIFENFHQ